MQLLMENYCILDKMCIHKPSSSSKMHYKSKIDRLISERTGEIVMNGSHAHASTIIERMFARANYSVKILSSKFDARIYGEPETVKQAELFLAGSGREAKILLENIGSDEKKKLLEKHPFFSKLALHEGLEIRELPNELSDEISVGYALMDDYGYRVERDGLDSVAVAAFGDIEFSKQLDSLFEKLWKKSEKVSINFEDTSCSDKMDA